MRKIKIYAVITVVIGMLICMNPVPLSAEEEMICITLSAKEVTVIEEHGHLYATVPLILSHNARVMALLFTLSLPEGWHISTVEIASEAIEGTITTYAYESMAECRRVILYESTNEFAEISSGEAFLVISLTAECEVREGTAEIGVPSSGGIYIYNNGNNAKKIPLKGENISLRGNIKGDNTTASFSITSILPQTATEPNTETMVEMPKKLEFAHYVGCRETPIIEGRYTVQFLFLKESSEDEAAVVYCIEGRDCLILKVETALNIWAVAPESKRAAEYPAVFPDGRVGVWVIFTFEGLQNNERYVFQAENEKTNVQIVYENGVLIN